MAFTFGILSGIISESKMAAVAVAPAASFPESGLLARYQFEDDLTDSFGSYDGTGQVTSYATGKIGKCIQLASSTGDGVNTGIPDTTFDGRKAYDFAMWIKYTSSGNFTTYWWTGGYYSGAVLQLYGTGLNYYRQGGGGNLQYSGLGLNDGNWHLIVGGYDGTNTRLNVDNGTLLDASTGDTTSITTGTANVWIGTDDSASYTFNGNIDQVYIYDRMLSNAEIATLWNSGNGV